MSKLRFPVVLPSVCLLLLTLVSTASPSAATRQSDDLIGTEFLFATDVSFDTDEPGGQPFKIIFLGDTVPGGSVCDLPETVLSKTVVAPGNVPALQGQRARFVYINHEQIYPAGTQAELIELVGNCGAVNIYRAVITNVPHTNP